eukprot:SAG11_NODE_23991_length_379_cov_5.846429_1_plen_29_part_10
MPYISQAAVNFVSKLKYNEIYFESGASGA